MWTSRHALRAATVAVLTACALSCEGQPLLIIPTTLANGIVGRFYQQVLDDDSQRATSWQVAAGRLPDGLSLHESNGIISGTLSEAGTFEFIVKSHRKGIVYRMGQRLYTVSIVPELTVGTTLEPARQDVPYDEQVNAEGGVPPYSYEAVGLPGGIAFDTATGRLSGTPIESDQGRTLEVTVTDSGAPQQTVVVEIAFEVKPPPVQITTATLPDGTVGSAYAASVAVSGGFAPYEWSITDGVLPPGSPVLRINQATGEITGTPNQAGDWTFTVTAQDDDVPPDTAEMQFTMTISP